MNPALLGLHSFGSLGCCLSSRNAAVVYREHTKRFHLIEPNRRCCFSRASDPTDEEIARTWGVFQSALKDAYNANASDFVFGSWIGSKPPRRSLLHWEFEEMVASAQKLRNFHPTDYGLDRSNSPFPQETPRIEYEDGTQEEIDLEKIVAELRILLIDASGSTIKRIADRVYFYVLNVFATERLRVLSKERFLNMIRHELERDRRECSSDTITRSTFDPTETVSIEFESANSRLDLRLKEPESEDRADLTFD